MFLKSTEQQIAIAKISADSCRRQSIKRKNQFVTYSRSKLTSAPWLVGSLVTGFTLGLLKKTRVVETRHVHHEHHHDQSSNQNTIKQMITRIATGLVTSAVVGHIQSQSSDDHGDNPLS